MNDMAMEKLLFQMETHLRECMKMEKGMVMELTGIKRQKCFNYLET